MAVRPAEQRGPRTPAGADRCRTGLVRSLTPDRFADKIVIVIVGNHQQAIDRYREALAGFRDLGFTSELVIVLDHLGQSHLALAQHDQARTAWEEARTRISPVP
ncbi:tetratricopeptide repeat protein [Saccharothrix sp. AJ9571]|nr:tetratricopeptide repeat protein [Saccharothrix sp. AJ9571]